jgi:8-oxo-dGTP pyrophosphatase MutT (NUDIX family)
MTDFRVKKVTAIVLRNRGKHPEVLVFDHPLDDGTFMIQLPAGTVEEGEAPESAVLRELHEETGVHVEPGILVGTRDEEWEGQQRRRWIYLLDAPDGLAEEWAWTCDCGAPTRCYWLAFEQAAVFAPQQPWLDLARLHVRSQSDER